MTNTIRRQLTLFVEQKEAEIIERIRQTFNPKQFEIIKAHVTLCREDEIQNLEKVISNLNALTQPDFDIEFGEITRFDDGKGLFLPARTTNEDFDNLRIEALRGLIDNPRKQEPHITLMHPRNSTCTDNIFQQIKTINLPTKLRFKKISLIEQKDSGQWITLKEFNLGNRK
jgi:2'-5' RNA ligase